MKFSEIETMEIKKSKYSEYVEVTTKDGRTFKIGGLGSGKTRYFGKPNLMPVDKTKQGQA